MLRSLLKTNLSSSGPSLDQKRWCQGSIKLKNDEFNDSRDIVEAFADYFFVVETNSAVRKFKNKATTETDII